MGIESESMTGQETMTDTGPVLSRRLRHAVDAYDRVPYGKAALRFGEPCPKLLDFGNFSYGGAEGAALLWRCNWARRLLDTRCIFGHCAS